MKIRDDQQGGSAGWTDFAHTGPDRLAGRYLRTFWQPVCRSDDLPSGRAKPIRVMSDDFSLYRGDTGVPHLVAFRCAHRGTQLSTGWVEGDNLRCFYHGWTYDPSGRCVEQPAEPEPFSGRIRIRSYPVQDYLGLIFAYLGEGEAPPMPRYAEFESGGARDTRMTTRACSFFQNLENLCDTVHVSFVHRQSRAGISNMPIPSVSGSESEWGMVMHFSMPNGTVQVSHLGMPNIKWIQVPAPTRPEGLPIEYLHWLVPNDDAHHTQFTVELARVAGNRARTYREQRAAWYRMLTTPAPEVSAAILAGHRRVQDVDEERDRVQIVWVQDDVAQIGQGLIADREAERLGRSDANVVLLRSLWSRELCALADGRPLTPWARGERLERTTWAGTDPILSAAKS